MKIAVSSTGKGLKSKASPVFGRCNYFIIAEIKDKEIKNSENVKNEGRRMRGGVGITAGELIGNKGVDAVITVNIGPRAFSVLKELSVKVYSGIPESVEENINALINEKLDVLENPKPGGFGRGRGRRGR